MLFSIIVSQRYKTTQKYHFKSTLVRSDSSLFLSLSPLCLLTTIDNLQWHRPTRRRVAERCRKVSVSFSGRRGYVVTRTSYGATEVNKSTLSVHWVGDDCSPGRSRLLSILWSKEV